MQSVRPVKNILFGSPSLVTPLPHGCGSVMYFDIFEIIKSIKYLTRCHKIQNRDRTKSAEVQDATERGIILQQGADKKSGRIKLFAEFRRLVIVVKASDILNSLPLHSTLSFNPNGGTR
jgi:hypothetical protein